MPSSVPHFCAFRSATGTWCWEKRDHEGQHIDASGCIMPETEVPKWSLNGFRYTAPEILRMAAGIHPDGKQAEVLEEIAAFLDRKEE